MIPNPSIRRDDAIPLYHQIYLSLRDEILSGALPTGAMVPTEHDLAARFAVSRITARRALDELAANQLVERKRRIGTRVIFARVTPPIEASADQAVESLIAFGRDTHVRVIAFSREEPTPDMIASLGLASDEDVIRALRLRSLGDKPLGVIESFVPASIAGDISRKALMTTPLLELLRGAGHVFGAGSQTISAVAAGPELAELLETEARAPIIRIERLLRSVQGKGLARTIAQYRGDRYRLNLDLAATPHPIMS